MRRSLATLLLGTALTVNGCNYDQNITEENYQSEPRYGSVHFSKKGVYMFFDFDADERAEILVLANDGWTGDSTDFRRECQTGSNPDLITFVSLKANYLMRGNEELKEKVRTNLSSEYLKNPIIFTSEMEEDRWKGNLDKLRNYAKPKHI